MTNFLKVSLLSFALFFITTPQVFANHDYDKIDEHARKAPTKLRHSLEKLTAYLIEPAENDFEKVRAFYVWLADNVAYDVAALNPKDRPDQEDVARVLKSRRAVCHGYALLFKNMCELASVRCHFVAGWSKRLGGRNGIEIPGTGHAWNAVWIDDKWHLIDATWGAGTIGRKKGKKLAFTKKFSDHWFLTAPRNFANTHAPYNPAWQLMDCPIPWETFETENIVMTDIPEEDACKTPQDFKTAIDAWEKLDTDDRYIEDYKQGLAYHPTDMGSKFIVMSYRNKGYAVANAALKKESDADKRAGLKDACVYFEEALPYAKSRKDQAGLKRIIRDYEKIIKSKHKIIVRN